MKQALEALEESLPDVQECITDKRIASHQEQIAKHEAAIYALRTALAQTEQEPVTWVTRRTGDGGAYVDGYESCEPTDYGAFPVYTAPPKREWKGLTSDDKHFLLANAWNKEQAFDDFMEAIDKFLEEKNT